MVKGFKAFVLRGNVVDLAVAVVVGVAFGVVVPLIAAIGGKPDFSALSFTINNSKFLYGEFINAVIAFLIIALVIYFLVVIPYTAMVERSRKEPPADPTVKKCPECLSEIPKDARRCALCTSPQPA